MSAKVIKYRQRYFFLHVYVRVACAAVRFDYNPKQLEFVRRSRWLVVCGGHSVCSLCCGLSISCFAISVQTRKSSKNWKGSMKILLIGFAIKNRLENLELTVSFLRQNVSGIKKKSIIDALVMPRTKSAGSLILINAKR